MNSRLKHSRGIRIAGLAIGLGLVSFSSHASPHCPSALSTILSRLSKHHRFAPQETRLIRARALEPSVEAVAALRNQDVPSVRYVVTLDDRLFFLSELEDTWSPENALLINIPGPNGEEIATPIKESGLLRYTESDQRSLLRVSKKNFKFEQDYGFDLAEDELSLVGRKLDDLSPLDENFVRNANSKFQKARILKCSQIYNNHKSPTRFFADLFGVDVTLTTASILIADPERFFDKSDYDLLAADYATTAIYKATQGGVGYFVTTKGMPYFKRLGFRSGQTLFINVLQYLYYREATDNSADKISYFNYGWGVFSMFKADLLDRALLRSLPEFAFKTCLNNPAIRILVSPTALRFSESLASKTLYFTLRPKVVNWMEDLGKEEAKDEDRPDEIQSN